MSTTPHKFYEQRIATLTHSLLKAKKQHAALGWLRLLTVVLPLIVVYLVWPVNDALLVVIAIAVIALFLFLVSRAINLQIKIRHLERLIEINVLETEILKGNYQQLPDGNEYLQRLHLHDNDLDLFGKASLFQYINRAASEQGKTTLAASFVEKTNRTEILNRQQAIKELANKPVWRQDLQGYAEAGNISGLTEQSVLEWMQDKRNSFESPAWQLLRWLVPVISFVVLGFYLNGSLTDQPFIFLLLLILGFVYSWYKKISKSYTGIARLLPQLKAFSKLLQTIEAEDFDAEWLKDRQDILLQKKHTASTQIDALNRILQRFDYRLNPVVHIPLSVFLFWDLQQALALQQWKKQQTGQIEKWFAVLGDMEMIGSLATLHFNHPSWNFPVITNQWFQLECKSIGHPLIKESKIVHNSFAMHEPPCIALITGSNMAGKSTFLRTIGVNMTLAMTGAPVRADYLKVPVVQTICSMRIADNLEEETSTFYAELKKIKRIVEAVEAGEKVFILVDEMLRGTNTLDRHKGSEALIKQLIRHHAVGIIASHDTALSILEQEFPGKLHNYHFDSVIMNEEIVFDYLLKENVCTSTNASLLMKKIGIKLD